MSETKLNILLETKLGIDPTTTGLASTAFNEYWIHDENADCCLVGYHGAIVGNCWAVDGSDDFYITSSGTSELWQYIALSQDTILT